MGNLDPTVLMPVALEQMNCLKWILSTFCLLLLHCLKVGRLAGFELPGQNFQFAGLDSQLLVVVHTDFG